jgi:hypothetical protein
MNHPILQNIPIKDERMINEAAKDSNSMEVDLDDIFSDAESTGETRIDPNAEEEKE